MILSEAPSVRVTADTAQSISDEILGGAIKLCGEAGYKKNVAMLTYFWTGFLLSSREQLEECGLVEDVLSVYTRSLAKGIPKLSDDRQSCESVDKLCRQYWNNQTGAFTSLNTETEISTFFRIANTINQHNDPESACQLKTDPRQSFSRIIPTLHYNIYNILHQIDSKVGIRYKDILGGNRASGAPTSGSGTGDAPSSLQSAPPSDEPTRSRRNHTPLQIKAIGILLVIILGIVAIGSLDRDTDPKLEPVAEPESGTILSGEEDYDGSELTIAASGGSSCVVKLKTSSGTTRLSFYVRAGDTVTIRVPREYLYVYFASGSTWYGEEHLFGENTSYSMDDEVRDFTKYTWEYTLYPVTNGNFSETPIDADEF